MRLIVKAIENDAKEKMYLKWLHDDARYSMTFDDYVNASIPYRKSTQAEKEEIMRRYGGGMHGDI